MYLPAHFAESRTEVLHRLIQEHPLAVLVTFGANELNANHIPFELEPAPAPFGILRGHVARTNPVWREFSTEVEALLVFQGPQHYISPSWYPTKQETGKVVPTFNYMVVHGYGRLRVIEDRAWLRALVGRLTHRHEAARQAPWQVSDAPEDYLERQLEAIVGLEMPLSKLVGKWKLSQNRPQTDRKGVVDGLRAQVDDADALAMADSVQQCLEQQHGA
jgi:transcriptional regulator